MRITVWWLVNGDDNETNMKVPRMWDDAV